MTESKASTPAGGERLLTDAMVLTMDGQRRAYARGYVWMRDGRIHRVGPMAELGPVPESVERRALPGHVVMPGLVNCHTHLSNGLLRGIYDEMPLEVWFASGMWPVLESLDAPAGEAGASLALIELMCTGVTTTASGEIGVVHPELLDGVLTAVERSGMRAIVARIAMDSPDESDQAQFIPAKYREKPGFAADEVRRLRRRFNSGRISVVPEALGVMRCTPDMIRTMHALAADENCLFTMHAASSPGERDESRRRFGHGSIAELERLGVLAPRTLLAHAIWLDDEEIAILARNGTGISHNPIANAYYAAGVARLRDLLRAGARVGLGVDGASTNNSQNVWETMKMAMLFQKQQVSDANFGSAELALELMTRGGAAALHMEDEIGSLEPGKRADVIAIDAGRPALAPTQTVVSNLVYSNDPLAVREVYVDGEPLVRAGEHVRLDHRTVVAEASRALAPVLQRSGLDTHVARRSAWQWQ